MRITTSSATFAKTSSPTESETEGENHAPPHSRTVHADRIRSHPGRGQQGAAQITPANPWRPGHCHALAVADRYAGWRPPCRWPAGDRCACHRDDPTRFRALARLGGPASGNAGDVDR